MTKPLTILPCISGLELEQFVSFPWKLYTQASLWVPPLKKDERDLLTPTCHPFWQTARRRLFLARRGERIVGRIAAIIDDKYNAYAQERCGAFGFFEAENDPQAAQGLLKAAAQWLFSEGMDYMRGPVNPSTNYTCGVLVQGYTEAPALMMPYNPPYYANLLESWNMYKEQDLFAYRITRTQAAQAKLSLAQIEEQLALSGFSARTARKETLAEDIPIMLALYRESWAKNWYFSPLSTAEEEVLVKELGSIVDCNYFLLFFHGNEPAAGMVALPDLTPLLRRINGSPSLKTFFDYFALRKQFQSGYRIMLFGIREAFRLQGLPLMLFAYMLNQAEKNPLLEWVEGSWVLEDNHAICDLIEDFGGTITKRYRIYRKELLPEAFQR